MRTTLLVCCLAAAAALAACTSDDPPAQLAPDGSVGADGAAGDPDGAAAPTDGASGPVDGNVTPPPGDGGTTPSGDTGVVGPTPDSGILDQCNPVTQDCMSMLDKCRIEPAMMGGGTQCVPRGANDLALGAVCRGGDCEAGLVCVNTATVARCVRACDRSTGAPCSDLGPDYDCRLQVRTTNWGACDQLPPLCDPLTLAPCAADQACQPTRRFDGSFQFRCRTPGTGAEGQRCENAGCQRGLMCVREEMVSLCRAPCDPMGAACPMPQMCAGNVLMQSYCR